jgi:hypothetical protein
VKSPCAGRAAVTAADICFVAFLSRPVVFSSRSSHRPSSSARPAPNVLIGAGPHQRVPNDLGERGEQDSHGPLSPAVLWGRFRRRHRA